MDMLEFEPLDAAFVVVVLAICVAWCCCHPKQDSNQEYIKLFTRRPKNPTTYGLQSKEWGRSPYLKHVS
jgi:ABC-type uncharacterized transport system auxiliary subunit